MTIRKYSALLLFFVMIAGNAWGAAAPPMPAYNVSSAPTGGTPQAPEYLPNGAINLDYVWTNNGGARLYWNTAISPQELKMNGAYWVDPALVPQLFPDKAKASPRKRYYRRRVAVKKTAVKPPANVASTALQSKAIPLPATPVATPKAGKEKRNIPPLTAPQSKMAPPISHDGDNYVVTPPRLQ